MQSEWQTLIERLRGVEYRHGFQTKEAKASRFPIEFADGLSDAEISRTERCFGFKFPPDLRDFLQTALPVGSDFPNWRDGDEKELQHWLDWPKDGLLFQLEADNFWLPEWGHMPDSLKEASEKIVALVEAAPRMIPIFAHRMIPAEPQLSGNPVFSIYGADIIYYGKNLMDYFGREFLDLKHETLSLTQIRPIQFWDTLME